MQTFMLKLDRRLRRHRWVVLGTWLALVVAAVPLAMRQGDHLTGGGYAIPGSGSAQVAQQLHAFGGAERATLAAVLVPADGAAPADVRAAVRRLAGAARAVSDVSVAPAAERRALAAADRTAARQRPLIVPLRATVDDEQAIDVAIALRQRLGIADAHGEPVALHLVGQAALWAGLQDLTKEDLAEAEATGFPIVALILVAVFGALVAALLPLGLGLVSVLVTGALIYLLSLATDMSVFVTNMASMIGIGVAVDYSLFVLSRYRQEIRAGADPETARGTALATSGVAVAFSGMTVMVSLAGLYLVDATAIRSMALGAIVVVAVSVLASATLLPALITLLGRRAHEPGRAFAAMTRAVHRRRASRAVAAASTPRSNPGNGAHAALGAHAAAVGAVWPDSGGDTDGADADVSGAVGGAAPRPGFWDRWTARVMRRPVIAAALAAAILIGLALPALDLRTTDGALRQFPVGNETRMGFEAASRITGPGASSPIDVIAPAAQAAAVRRVVRADPEIARVAAPRASADGHSVLVRAIPRHDGESPQTREAIGRLRAALPAGAAVGGTPAALRDFDDHVMGSMWKVALFVLSMSFLVLLVLLRSVVLPLKAVVMNLLSVGAAYGVLVLIFGRVDTLTPPLVLAVVFGLSMDYEVFLLTRIRERFAATGDTGTAVAQGLASSAGTITSAALIMVCVFAVFALTGVPSIQQLGVGCAVAIAVDATLVRLVLVPAAMELLGDWNWWLPRPLARILPETSIETLGEDAAAVVAAPAQAPAPARSA